MRFRSGLLIAVTIAVLALLTVWQWQWNLSEIEMVLQAHPFVGMGLYVLMVIAAVVLLPLTSLPLLPIAARIFGVVPTALLSIAGWWIGCLIAFQIARLGRPWIARVISLQSVDRLEKRIPPDIGFIGIVLLRMTLPVDVTSFALGLFKDLPFSTYALASLIGITPFAFAWSYAGGALGRGEFLLASVVATGMTGAVLGLRRGMKKT